jgi:putative membrane protein
MYNGYQFFGMDMLWWFVWIILMLWIFVAPYNIPGQRHPKNSSLDILQMRFASGQITKEEFEESRQILLRDIIKP